MGVLEKMYLTYLLVITTALNWSKAREIYRAVPDDTKLMKTVGQVLNDFPQRPHESIFLAIKLGNYTVSWFPLTRPMITNGGQGLEWYCWMTFWNDDYDTVFYPMDYRCYRRVVAYFFVGAGFIDDYIKPYYKNRDSIIVYFKSDDILSDDNRDSVQLLVRRMIWYRNFKLLVIGTDHAVYTKVLDPKCTTNFELVTIGEVGDVNDTEMIKWNADLYEVIDFYENLSPRYCRVRVCITSQFPRLIRNAMSSCAVSFAICLFRRQKHTSQRLYFRQTPNINACDLMLTLHFLVPGVLDDTFVNYRQLLLVVLKATPIPPWRTFTMILSGQIWTLTAVTFFAVAVAWSWLNPRENITSSLWTFFYSILGFGVSNISRRFPTRCLSLAWFFFVIHFLLFFSTDYFDVLTTTIYERQISTVQEIVSNGFTVYGHAEYNKVARDYIPNYQGKTITEMKHLFPDHKTAIMVDDVFFYERYVIFYLGKKMKKTPVYVIKDWAADQVSGMYAKVSFRDEFKRVILQAHASGATEHQDSGVGMNFFKAYVKFRFAETQDAIALQIQHIILPLLFVVAASIVGLVTLCLEIICHKINKPHNSTRNLRISSK